MDTGCIEVVVKRKDSTVMKFLKILTIVLAVAFFLIGCTGLWLGFIVAVVCAVAAFFVSRNVNIEYEYTYLDRELRLAKIMNLSHRKEIGKYDLEKMEILAPITSYHLDDYKNRKTRELDFSSHEAKQPDPRYLMFLNGDTKLILEPSEEMVNAIRMFAPRKTFNS